MGRKNFSFGIYLHDKKSVKSLIKFEYELGGKNFSFGLIKFEYDIENWVVKIFSLGSALHDKNPGEHVKATLCLVIYHTIFDSDGNVSRRPFVWLQVRHGYFGKCALLRILDFSFG